MVDLTIRFVSISWLLASLVFSYDAIETLICMLHILLNTSVFSFLQVLQN
jgi:hypothetical protein